MKKNRILRQCERSEERANSFGEDSSLNFRAKTQTRVFWFVMF